MNHSHVRLLGHVCHGSLAIETSDGRRFSDGDGTGEPISLKFVDRAAEREIVFDPAIALGELFTQGRLLISGGTISDLLDLLGRNLQAMIPPVLGTLRQHARIAPVRKLDGFSNPIGQTDRRGSPDAGLYRGPREKPCPSRIRSQRNAGGCRVVQRLIKVKGALTDHC